MIFVIIALVLLVVWRYSLAVRQFGAAWAIRDMSVAATAGLLAGLLIGFAARAGMRAITLANGELPRFSWSGTAAVVAAFAGFGIIFGVVYAGLFRYLVRGKGWAYGLLLAASSWYPLAEAAAQDLTKAPAVAPFIIISGLMVAAMWVPYGLLLEALYLRWQAARLPSFNYLSPED